MNITQKKDILKFLFEEINLDLYKYKMLSHYMRKVLDGEKTISELSVLNVVDDGWILILCGGDNMLFIHGENWQDKQLQEIKKIFDINKFPNFSICGDNDLISKLIEFYNLKNFKEKSRIYYSTNDVIIYDSKNVKIVRGSFDRLDELAAMLQQYFHEEYNGLNNKTIQEMQEKIYNYIVMGNIFVLFDTNANIRSFCTINDPDIGILFTKTEYRNMGYGKIILSYCSKLLLVKNNIVYLMTDKQKLESNTVSKAVGFKPYYNYTTIEINNK